MEITYEKYNKIPYYGIEGDLYYSFDNKKWYRIRFVNDFVFHRSLFRTNGYLSVLYCGNDDELSQLIKCDKRFSFKLEFKVDGAGKPREPIYFKNVRVINDSMECYGMNDTADCVVRSIRFKSQRAKIS
ncbi:MAG: hypothetical protein Q8910_00435 [Bacteroidota bacterium]|nr:hypothetical protein [Bacteroidota bacterium]